MGMLRIILALSLAGGLILLVALLSRKKGLRDWRDADNGQIKWALDCNFHGGENVSQRSGPGDQCGGYCLGNSQCSHFTWMNGSCYLQRFPEGRKGAESDSKGAVCGYIPHRIGVGPDPIGELGELVWQEEFEALDLTRWKHLVTGWRGGNNEFQYYTNRRENSFVVNGVLHIRPTFTADRFDESFLYNGTLDLNQEGCNLDLDNGCKISAGRDVINPIQSARMVTENSFNFTFGSVVVRAKMPKGDWIWPAIWMLPTGSTYGGWPQSGEIDIVEVRGNANLTCSGKPIGRQLAGSALHWGSNPGSNRYHLTHWEKAKSDPDFSSAFHLYRMDWLPSGFTFYGDGERIGSMSPPAGGFWELGGYPGNSIWASGSRMAPFDRPFHFVLNVAVGGNFFPDGCTNRPFNKPWARSDPAPMRKFWEARDEWIPTWEESAMQVDYIRVYDLK